MDLGNLALGCMKVYVFVSVFTSLCATDKHENLLVMPNIPLAPETTWLLHVFKDWIDQLCSSFSSWPTPGPLASLCPRDFQLSTLLLDLVSFEDLQKLLLIDQV
jgi:hypothetical protein